VPPADKGIRQDVRYYGRVQGVGFRYTAQRIAGGYPVSGYVENLGDGTVHLVVEGDKEKVAAYLKDVNKALERYIDHQVADEQCATGEFKDFSIRH
jgi:acylphosphatase